MSRSSFPVVVLGGSRSFPGGALALVGRVVRSLLARGVGLSVGCSVGVDAAVVSAAVAAGAASRLSLFAVFGPGGAGSWSGSAVSVVSSAVASGASVSWWAGGRPPVSASGSSSSVGLRGRLVARSLAAVSCAASSGRGCGAVFFVSGGWRSSPGSWGSVRSSVLLGVPVVVFPVRELPGGDVALGGPAFGPGFWRLPGLSRSCGAGRWVPAARSGLWSLGFRWVPVA